MAIFCIKDYPLLFGAGVTVIIDGGGREVICKARLLFALADLPAKAMLYNMTQFNGRFGCPTCKHEGEQVWTVPDTCSFYHPHAYLHKLYLLELLVYSCYYTFRFPLEGEQLECIVVFRLL